MSNAAGLSSGFDSLCPRCRNWYDSQVGHNCQPTYPTPTVVRSQEPTLRQRYAMAALTGLCANPATVDWGYRKLAGQSMEVADAMLAEERKS
jgi:hypothetical protein